MAFSDRATKRISGINASAVKGEPGTGYEDEDGKGPFACANCEYFDASDSGCGQKDMMEKSRRKQLADGRIEVEPGGCCDYVDRIGGE